MLRRAAILALLPAVLAGCSSSLVEFDTFRAPDASTLFRPLSVTSYRDKVLPPVAAEELVDASGRCAGAFVPVEPAAEQAALPPATEGGAPAAVPATVPGGPQSLAANAMPPMPGAASEVTPQQVGVALIPSAVALEMTECDVVKRAGLPERVEIGANDRGERSATLTYIQGPRPGIYRFNAGRLASMERAPEPPPQPKPIKRAPSKPKRTVANR